MVKAGIYGASGYTGQELLRLLLHHPQAEITAITSRQYKGLALPRVFPGFQGLTNLVFADHRPEELACPCR
jgi:N-acetyl-gamma-glutamyl-phosphate reductase